jgi:hypothetical protein
METFARVSITKSSAKFYRTALGRPVGKFRTIVILVDKTGKDHIGVTYSWTRTRARIKAHKMTKVITRTLNSTPVARNITMDTYNIKISG